MQHKKFVYIILGVIVLSILGGLGWYIFDISKSDKADNNIVTSPTRTEVPEDIVVPEMGAEVSLEVAPPIEVAPSSPGALSAFRDFNVVIDNNKFTPSNIAIYVGDIGNINFTAVDKDYTIVQPDHGFTLSIKKGENKFLQGQFTQEGKYLMYCSSCGDEPSDGPQGYIIVVPKN